MPSSGITGSLPSPLRTPHPSPLQNAPLTRGGNIKAVVFHDIGDIRLDDVPEPRIKDSTDAIVRLTASAICGTDLHKILTHSAPLMSALDAYSQFDKRQDGWIKVMLHPAAVAAA